MSRFSVYGIGRSPESDIHVDHPSVSRSHAELVMTADGRFYLTDCNSSGGTSIRKAGESAWARVRQTYVSKTDAVLLGGYQSSVQELIVGIKNAGGRAGRGASERTSKDDLPEGPVRRDISSGEILKQEDR